MRDVELETQSYMLHSPEFTRNLAAFFSDYLDDSLCSLALVAAEALREPAMENSIRV